MIERILRESALYLPVTQWLSSQGYSKVFAEKWGHDVVAIRESDGQTICVELKTACTRRLFEQVISAGAYFDLAFGAVPTRPRESNLKNWRRIGLGLLIVSGEDVKVMLEPEARATQAVRKNIAAALTRWTPDPTRIGGVPCLAGNGDAQRVCRAVDEYKLIHPAATWKEIYRDVPNHYVNHNSMRNGMKMQAVFRAIRERKKGTSGSSALLHGR